MQYHTYTKIICKIYKDKYLINVSMKMMLNCSALGQIYFNNIKYDIVVFLTIGTGMELDYSI